ncbi:MAG: 1-phosphatidylinositol-3-phosphate 5-kinase [Caeruleum heppii]|nr:MAG: 1-phosphatidylinositol-3-phosphate 5-kinase [Caeruleum heppii]
MSNPSTQDSSPPGRPRVGSRASIPFISLNGGPAQAQTLKAIHTSASQSDTLTTFNDFASPPRSSHSNEGRSLTEDLVHGGLSGLLTRFKDAVGGVKEKDKAATVNELTQPRIEDGFGPGRDHDIPTKPPLSHSEASEGAAPGPERSPGTGNHGHKISHVADSAGLEKVPRDSQETTSRLLRTATVPANPPASKSSIKPFSKLTASSAASPSVAPVTVVAYREGRRDAAERPSSNHTPSQGISSQIQPAVLNKDEQLKLEGHLPKVGDGLPGSYIKQSAPTKAATFLTIDRAASGPDNSSLRKASSERAKSIATAGDQIPPTDKEVHRQARMPTKDATEAIDAINDSSTSKVSQRATVVDEHNSSTPTSPFPNLSPSRTSPSGIMERSVDNIQDTEPLKTQESEVGRRRFSRRRGVPPLPTVKPLMTDDEENELPSPGLQHMKSTVLNKDFWMRDENCKECFHCGEAFSAWRRKHHCRTCGQIFDSKCTSVISGKRFGHPGSLRVCKDCMMIIDEYQDDDSTELGESDDDDEPLPTSFFRRKETHLKDDTQPPSTPPRVDDEHQKPSTSTYKEQRIPTSTPMMAIPATRRAGDDAHRRSAVLEINGNGSAGRPGSIKSQRMSFSSRAMPPSQKRRGTRHQRSRSVKTTHDDQAPFHRNPVEERGNGTRLPAFHNDSIIDPELALYMSDDASSGEEQTNIFTALNRESTPLSAEDGDRSLPGTPSATKKSRSRMGEKTGSVVSFASAEFLENSVKANRASFHRRFSRSKNSPETGKVLDPSSAGSSPPKSRIGSRMIRSASLRGATAPAVELNAASLQHVRKLLRQLLQDAAVPNVRAWERALIPMLLQCTDDVNPDVSRGDDMDIRHYIKIKKIPGGRPADTAYVSGVVFSKNLALKCMPRSLSHPRILTVTFSLEYDRHEQHFMSLGPVLAQEKEHLRNMVNRIAALRPSLLLVQRSVPGLALQYLAEAGIATAYNVKPAVLEAVSRCAQTDIISSVNMLSLKTVHVGRSGGFDVKTYLHSEIPGKKKTYMYVSGCPPDLGCTIVLRGADMDCLAKVKRITEFMVYIVYNLKLETCLMRDEFVLIPSITDDRQFDSKESRPAAVDAVAGLDTSPKPGHKSREGLRSEQASAADSNAAVPEDVPQVEHRRVPTALAEANRVDIESLPEDVPMPTFYGDMVEKHQTKILSASPFVKFMQPYLLMRAREQERRLAYLKRLRDQDEVEIQRADYQPQPQGFYLIKPEMVHETVTNAPKKVIEVLHAVHDAEYDKALHNYHTQKRQWEAYIAGNMNLFDPFAHQKIIVLYTLVCTATAIPCAGPDLLALSFYNEHDTDEDFESDCTLGQYVEELCLSANTVCSAHGCDKKMREHHRSYVHGEARVTVFVEKTPCKLRGLQETILMWSYCKICKKETQVMPMSENTWKYSFGKYLELSFWSNNLRLRASFCPHDLHRDHLRYFGYKNVALRIHYDPIQLLEIVVPRARITWKVENDLRLKNRLFTATEERINRFMTSVKSRIEGIGAGSVVPEKAEACNAEIEKLSRRANDEHTELIHKLQEAYMNSRYYEILPLNQAVRVMQEKVADWDSTFADFDADFFPSEKDITRLAQLQMRKMFDIDREESFSSLASAEDEKEPHQGGADVEKVAADRPMELTPKPTQVSLEKAHNVLTSVVEEDSGVSKPTTASGEGEVSDQIATGEGEVVPANPTPGSAPATDGKRPTEADQAAESRRPSINDHRLSRLASRSLSPSGSRTVSTETNGTNPSDQLEQLPEEQTEAAASSAMKPRPSGIPRPTENPRRSGTRVVTTGLPRASSQPARHKGQDQNKGNVSAGSQASVLTSDSKSSDEGQETSAAPSTKSSERSVSEKLRLHALTGKNSSAPSLIPRSMPGKMRASRVSALAKHFEQLSKEFEKERLRERRLRAAKSRQSRGYPMSSSKPIVEVYRNVHEAVEEKEPSDEDVIGEVPTQPSTETSNLGESNNEQSPTAPKEPTAGDESQRSDAKERGSKAAGEPDPSTQNTSDAEGDVSEADRSYLEDVQIPDATSSESTLDLKLELPKHERSSLMKMLTTFWAERSASGWSPLAYPLPGTDHVFLDSDVIVREDEPSSLIAFALSSQDYRGKLASIRKPGGSGATSSEATGVKGGTGSHQDHFDTSEEVEVEKSLLRSTGTHLKYQFAEGTSRMLCKIFYAEQFDAVRRKCGVADRIVESLSRCIKWDSKGGKTRSVFLKTLDERLVLKSLSPVETQAFLRFAPAYFQIMSEALFHELPSVIAKMLGFYQIIIKNPVTGVELKWDVVVMENLFYDRTPTRIFDLKGSMRNRKIESTGEQNEVLLDENMVEFIYESPLFAREHSKKLLRASVWNDTLFLARQNVMDYSLMIAIDEERKELVVGIIDCIRTYTWDKKLESWIKDRGKNKPTVTSPKEYKSRFREAMGRYVLQAPNCWHQFQAQQIEKRPLRIDQNVATKDGEKPEAERRRWFVNV